MFGLFKHDAQKMEKKKDIKGLIKALDSCGGTNGVFRQVQKEERTRNA